MLRIADANLLDCRCDSEWPALVGRALLRPAAKVAREQHGCSGRVQAAFRGSGICLSATRAIKLFGSYVSTVVPDFPVDWICTVVLPGPANF